MGRGPNTRRTVKPPAPNICDIHSFRINCSPKFASLCRLRITRRYLKREGSSGVSYLNTILLNVSLLSSPSDEKSGQRHIVLGGRPPPWRAGNLNYESPLYWGVVSSFISTLPLEGVRCVAGQCALPMCFLGAVSRFSISA